MKKRQASITICYCVVSVPLLCLYMVQILLVFIKVPSSKWLEGMQMETQFGEAICSLYTSCGHIQKYGFIKTGPTLLPLAAATLGALFCFVLHIPRHFWY